MIKSWNQFNEDVNPWTYIIASGKLKAKGHQRRTTSLTDFAEKKLLEESIRKFGIGEVEFKGNIFAHFIKFSFEEAWDSFFSNDSEYLNIGLCFFYPEIVYNGSKLFFLSIEYDVEADKMATYSWSEAGLQHKFGKNKLSVLHKADADKIWMALVNSDWKSEINYDWIDYTEEKGKLFQEAFDKLISKDRSEILMQ
jgi:hypothetical protein